MRTVIDEKYDDNYETPNNGEWITIQSDHGVLIKRRKELGLTQQQVADAAHIQLRQYQRLESGERTIGGTSMRIGLSVCSALQLDPYRFSPVKRKSSTE